MSEIKPIAWIDPAGRLLVNSYDIYAGVSFIDPDRAIPDIWQPIMPPSYVQ